MPPDLQIAMAVNFDTSECQCETSTGAEVSFCYRAFVLSTVHLSSQQMLFFSSAATPAGKKFDCKWMPYIERLNLLSANAPAPDEDELGEQQAYSSNYNILSAHTTQVKFAANPPIVTGSSSNHFSELMLEIGTAQRHFPNSPLIVYDLGLNKSQIDMTKTWCKVHVRAFNFSAWPSNVRQLSQFRWKPILIAVRSFAFHSLSFLLLRN